MNICYEYTVISIEYEMLEYDLENKITLSAQLQNHTH